MKKLWNNIVLIGSGILFLIVAFLYLTRGDADAVKEKYQEMVNKNRGRRDALYEREVETAANKAKAKSELKDIQNKAKIIEDRINSRTPDKTGNAIDDFQRKYGNE